MGKTRKTNDAIRLPAVKISGTARAGSSTEAWCELTPQRKAPRPYTVKGSFQCLRSREVSSLCTTEVISQERHHPPCQTHQGEGLQNVLPAQGKEGMGAPSREALFSMIGHHRNKTGCSETFRHGMRTDLRARAPSGCTAQPSYLRADELSADTSKKL